jgi:Zn-dependent oligopeptidase
MSFAPKRQRLNERKADIVYKLVQAKWVDEYDVKKVKRIPIAYAMRMDDFDPQNEAKRHVNAEATKKVSSGAGAGSKHKKKLSAKKVGHSRSTTTFINNESFSQKGWTFSVCNSSAQ